MPQHISAFRDAHHHVAAWPISGAAVVVESGNPGTDVRHVRGNGVARNFASRRRIDSLANSTQATVPERSGYPHRSRMGELGLAASAVAAYTAGWRDRRQSLPERSSVAAAGMLSIASPTFFDRPAISANLETGQPSPAPKARGAISIPARPGRKQIHSVQSAQPRIRGRRMPAASAIY